MRTLTLTDAAFDLLCNLLDANDDVDELVDAGLTDSATAHAELVAAVRVARDA